MPPRRSTRGMVVPDPEDEAEIEVLESASPSVFEGVIVPAKNTRPSARQTRDSISSAQSAEASTRGPSPDYDTPATSAAVTPVESFSRTRRSLGALEFNLGEPSINASSKRKRASAASNLRQAVVVDTTKDEELARQLQEDEYREPVAKKSRPTSKPNSSGNLNGKGKKVALVPDSDDEEDDFNSDYDMAEVSAAEPSDDDMPLMNRAARARPSVVVASKVNKPSLSTPSSPADSDDAWLESLEEGAEFSGGDTDQDIAAHLRNRPFRPGRRPAGPSDGYLNRKQRRRIKLMNSHPEIGTMWHDLKRVPVITPVAGKQPDTITRTLKSFQLEGLDWMIKQEKTHYKGGLLGDEMGMGKTIQAVSLIMSDFPAKAPSLVLVPPVALIQWQNEINSYTNGKLKVLVVHNSNAKSKNLTVKMIKSYNVVLMSYNSLESMFRKQEKGWTRGETIVKQDSPLHAVDFHRLILDEAHSIKSRNTGVARACFAMKGTYRWCLSGTPVQNRIGEFFSLLRFLCVTPFAQYFCEACDCAQIHWTINEDYRCEKCTHSASEHRSVFNEEILNPMLGPNARERKSALEKLHLITARVMLRRMKKDHTASMELPPKLIRVHNEFFGKMERDFSSSIMQNTNREFDTYVSRGVVLNNYANIFGLIMQMRQVANHPDLILKKNASGGQNVLVCNICDEPAEDAIRSLCKHDFCRSCAKSFVQSCEQTGATADCPRCHLSLSIDFEQPEIEQDAEMVKKTSIINRIQMSSWTSSTKIEMLVYDLYKLRSSKRTLKSIVFSQFTSMLQLVEWRLRRAGFKTVMLDGSMTPVQRQRSIDYFMNNVDVEVFLVSLKAGGVALNLTEASRVFIVDPWWNPAAEWQSADRCHRIGQARPCVITRLVIEDSVESRMVQLQEKKTNMIASTVNQDTVAMEKLSPEDLQFLFRGS